jgi:hypothetical protein
MDKAGQDSEPDARSMVNRVLVAATALLLSAELLFLVAVFVLLLKVVQEGR